MYSFKISVQLSWPAFTNVEEFAKSVPIEIWSTGVEAENGHEAKQQFLISLLHGDGDFQDLIKELRKYGVDIEQFKSVVHPYNTMGGYIINKKYKTKKEQKIRAALNTLEQFHINIVYSD